MPGPAGSPSQISAALLAAGVPRCRSRQLKLTFRRPPTNHLALGNFHCKTFFHGLNQTNSSLAARPQNFSGCRMDSLYRARYWAMDFTSARLAKAFGGGKTRSSWSTDVILVTAGAVIVAIELEFDNVVDFKGCEAAVNA